MDRIENKYFRSNNGVLQDQDQSGGLSSDSPSPTSPTAHSFAGLFMITGTATLLALVVSESVIWQKPVVKAKAYSQKYLFSPKRSKKINASDSSTDGSTTRGRVGSTDEAKVDEKLHDLENPSSTLHNYQASDQRNIPSDGISLAAEV
ncbi:Glutamate receptor [Quillaja saponaria]|uniref:Glutamate receptor n=1 Tax=Quillaja saponaria TaxID=32244 RepID=A0AAD7QDG8_QUISA|nr:Glutamate receptor [Quillaja saponaria]